MGKLCAEVGEDGDGFADEVITILEQGHLTARIERQVGGLPLLLLGQAEAMGHVVHLMKGEDELRAPRVRATANPVQFKLAHVRNGEERRNFPKT